MKGTSLSIVGLIPNLVTILALMTGFISVYFALSNHWESSILCICISGILDVVDGRLARLLKVTSSLGIELDSLSDLVSFGVSPALVWYLWMTHNSNHNLYIWCAATFYIACSAVRLARFNLFSHKIYEIKNDLIRQRFFFGVPVPIGGLYIILPIILNSLMPKIKFILNWKWSFFYVILIGALLASRIPTFALKSIKINKEYIWIVLLAFVLLICLFSLYPYYLICTFMCCYTFSIIFSILSFHKLSK
jgi:CDP-diacylglycerol--serine O-phosphatidyltransferase